MELYADGNEHFSAVVTVVSAAVIVVFALSDRSWPLVALGLLSFFIETIAVMHTVLFWAGHALVTPLILLVSLFTDRKRTVHDLLLGTVVTRDDVR